MRHFALFLDLHGRDVLVVGGAAAAARKAAVLAGAGARVLAIGSCAGPDMAQLADAGTVVWLTREFRDDDVSGKALIVVDPLAPGSGEVDGEALAARVSAAARRAGIPVNVVDRPKLCTFIWPAVIDRDPITVAVSSAGTAPVLARSVRERIEALLPARLGALARFAESFRAAVKATRGSGTARRRFWEQVFAGPIAHAVLAGDERSARERMLALLNRRGCGTAERGIVHLVGAGPGDPELLTLKALRILHEADVIVHDRLIGPRVLDYARRDAERIYVGKAKGSHARTQAEINELLARHARAGLRVARLKGGDPFVFGRGGEERDYLLARGIAVEVVPGITAAVACAAATGIPLTHRDDAQALTMITGHGRDGEPDLDWHALARGRQTIAVYMGGSAAGMIASRLIESGLDPATPASVVVNGTLESQDVEVGEVRELSDMAARAGDGPMLLLIGEVVRHADAWSVKARPLAVAQ